MSDFSRSYEILIDAPVHDVFDYCRDPRHLFEGWPELEVTDVIMTPEGTGTKAHIVGRFAKGMIVEQIEREYTEFIPDQRIVSKAHARVRFAGRTRDVATNPIFTWQFDPQGGDTKLTFGVVEKDLGWFLNTLRETVAAAMMAKKMNGTLAAIKTSVERQSPSASWTQGEQLLETPGARRSNSPPPDAHGPSDDGVMGHGGSSATGHLRTSADRHERDFRALAIYAPRRPAGWAVGMGRNMWSRSSIRTLMSRRPSREAGRSPVMTLRRSVSTLTP